MAGFLSGLMNPTIQNQNSKLNNKLEDIMTIIGMLTGAADKNQMLSLLVNRNPYVADAMNLVKNQYNGDSQKAFYEEANKMGINPDQVFSILKNRYGRIL